jgi:hypothetical protein
VELRKAIAGASGLQKRLKANSPETSEIERLAHKIPTRSMRKLAPIDSEEELLRRTRSAFSEGRFAEVSRRDLRRMIDCIWTAQEDIPVAKACVETISNSKSRGMHRAMVEAYFRRFPETHGGFDQLCRHLDRIASRKDSSWKALAETWKVFDPIQGPKTVGAALLGSDPGSVLKATGLTGELASGGFSRAAWRFACTETAESDAESVPKRVRALLRLAEFLGDLPNERAHYARALLKPLTKGVSNPALKRLVIGELVGRIGDPRLDRSRWAGLQRELEADFPEEDSAGLIQKLVFWLVENAVHQFLDVVDHDADPEQWPYRKAFWLSYLNAGHVTDAWVAFGPAAADRARDLAESSKSGVRLYADLTGGNQPGQSVLLMRIDNLIVGDWSHNGQCRFWTPASKAGRRLLNADGSWRSSYATPQLRTLDVHEPLIGARAIAQARAARLRATRPDHEEPHGGAKSYKWQRKFNEVIGELTDFRVHFEYDSLYPYERNRAWEPGSLRSRKR